MKLMDKCRNTLRPGRSHRWLVVLAVVFLAACSTTPREPQGLTLGDLLREANIPIENGGTTYRVVGWSPRGFYPYGFSHFGYWGYPWYTGYRPGYYGHASLRGRYVYPYYPLYYPYYGATPWYVWGHPVHGAYWRRSNFAPLTVPPDSDTPIMSSVNVSDELLASPVNQFGSVLQPTPWTIQNGSLSGSRAPVLGPDGREGRYTFNIPASSSPVQVISDPDAIAGFFANPEVRDLMVNDGKWKSNIISGGGRVPTQTISRSTSSFQSRSSSFTGSAFSSAGSSSRSSSSFTSSRTTGSQRAPSKARPKRPVARPAQKQIR